MNHSKEKPYGMALEKLLGEKTKVLSKAQAFLQMGMPETAEPFWKRAATLEERIAPQLDAIGRRREAAIHRISAATCYRNVAEYSSAANLFQAALAGPLTDASRAEVELHLEDCLCALAASPSSRVTVAAK